MHHARTLALFLVALSPLSSLRAQEVFLDEDFNGLSAPQRPIGWTWASSTPLDWFTGFGSTNGCMPAPPASSAASGLQLLGNNEFWNAGACGIKNSARMLSSAIPVLPGEGYRVSLDYYLDIDVAAGDKARIALANWQMGAPSPVLVAKESSGLLQGVWTHLEVDVPPSALANYSAPYTEVGLEFRITAAVPSTRAGWAIDNVRVTAFPQLTYTTGCDQSSPHDLDGDGSPDLWCPCFNFGQPGAGCANSATSGATITPAGSDRFLTDDLSIDVEGVPNGKPAILVRGGVATTPFASGAGILCLAGPLTRLGVRVSDGAGTASWGGSGYLSSNGWSPGTTLNFMVQYRDAGSGTCAGTFFNWSNSISLVVRP